MDMLTILLAFVGSALLMYSWNVLTGKTIFWVRDRLEHLYLHNKKFRDRVDQWRKKGF